MEAVQQDGDDEVVGARRAFGGVTSLPAAYAARHQRAAKGRQHPVAANTAATASLASPPTASLLEHGHSVVYDSELQRQPQEALIRPESLPNKRFKAGSPSNSQHSQPHAMPQLSPECSAASEGLAATDRHEEACQAAPDMTQQATIQEASVTPLLLASLYLYLISCRS